MVFNFGEGRRGEHIAGPLTAVEIMCRLSAGTVSSLLIVMVVLGAVLTRKVFSENKCLACCRDLHRPRMVPWWHPVGKTFIYSKGCDWWCMSFQAEYAFSPFCFLEHLSLLSIRHNRGYVVVFLLPVLQMHSISISQNKCAQTNCVSHSGLG